MTLTGVVSSEKDASKHQDRAFATTANAQITHNTVVGLHPHEDETIEEGIVEPGKRVGQTE